MRTHAEPIAVRLAARSGTEPGSTQPGQFVWRYRLWRVLAVQRHWVEAGAWWDDPRVRRARGQDAASAAVGGGDDDLLCEQEVWRVEAAVGAGGSIGVYDLACRGQQWQLRAVLD